MKNLTKLLILVGLILAVALSGCLGGDKDGGNETDNNSTASSHFYKNVTLTENDTTIRFEFTTNPSTGYGWDVTADKKSLLTETYNNISTTELPGAPGVHTFDFKAASPGTVALNFKYQRSFENNTTIEDLTYIIQVYQNNTVELISIFSPEGNLLPLFKNTTLEKNDTVIRITLGENPTTGYSWNLSMTPSDVLNKTEDHFNTSNSENVGAPGYHTWTFESLKAGNVTVTFDHNRNFEENSTTEIVVYKLKTNSDKTVEIRSISLDTVN